jgi:hypothetical protein
MIKGVRGCRGIAKCCERVLLQRQRARVENTHYRTYTPNELAQRPAMFASSVCSTRLQRCHSYLKRF